MGFEFCAFCALTWARMDGAEVTAESVQQHARWQEFQNSAAGARWAFMMGELTHTQCEELCEDWACWLLEAPEQQETKCQKECTCKSMQDTSVETVIIAFLVFVTPSL